MFSNFLDLEGGCIYGVEDLDPIDSSPFWGFRIFRLKLTSLSFSMEVECLEGCGRMPWTRKSFIK